MKPESLPPEALCVRAADGYSLRGFVWRHREAPRNDWPVVIVNPATSVRCRYYSRFASYLFEHGFDVVTYDYRGIGESRPARLRGFQASWLDWGRLDFEAILAHVVQAFPGQPIDVVAHSVGGFLVGLAPSNHRLRRVFTMGAQFAVWRDYAPRHRHRMFLKWHLFMPLLTALCGYFPGRRLGWLEDTPKGVVRDWSARKKRFAEHYRSALPAAAGVADPLAERFSALTAPILALSVTDDEFGTIPAIERLLKCFGNSPATHLRIAPNALGIDGIGHFAFFHSRFRDSLWPIPLAWLRSGQLPPAVPGRVVTRHGAL